MNRIPHEKWSISKNATNEELKSEVMLFLLQRDRAWATEILVKAIKEKEYIYTIRDDDNTEMWIYKDGIYVPEAKTYIEERIRQIMGDVFTSQLTNQVITKIQADTYIDQNDFFNVDYPELVAVQNGILNLKTRELKPFTPKLKFFNKIPVKYDPKAECPNIRKFLKDVLAREEDIKVMEELFGFLLFDDYFIEKSFMFYGGGRNGKGKTLALMKTFLGAENCTEVPLEDLERDMFVLGELFKKKANLCGDLSKTALKHTGNFKKLVGKDFITAARKFKTRVSFTNTAKMVFSSNELPVVYDVTDAFFNRWVILDFPYQFLTEEEIKQMKEIPANVKKRDIHIIDKITTPEELSGLLNLALDGLQRLFKNETFTATETTEKIKERWLMRSSSIMAFCMKHVKPKYGDFVIKKDFMRAYSQFCKANKLTIASNNTIKSVLGSHFGVVDNRTMINGKQTYVWEDITLIDEENGKNTLIDEEKISQGCYGFSGHSKKHFFTIDEKPIATLTNSHPNPTKCRNKKDIKPTNSSPTSNKKETETEDSCSTCGSSEIYHRVRIEDTGEIFCFCRSCFERMAKKDKKGGD